MRAIDLKARLLPVLRTRLLFSRARRRQLKVFLCGKDPGGDHDDIRIQLRAFLKNAFFCDAFLGEDIEELKIKPRPDKNHLSIEMGAARKAHLIIMFLGSPGTFAELTAFCLNHHINPKLVVFNEEEYRNSSSFISQGPLQLLNKDRIVFYDPREQQPTEELIRYIDGIISETLFVTEWGESMTPVDLSFDDFLVLAIVYAAFPTRYTEILHLAGLSKYRVSNALGTLVKRKMVEKVDEVFMPTVELSQTSLPRDIVVDIARVRAELFPRRFVDSESISDYLRLVSK